MPTLRLRPGDGTLEAAWRAAEGRLAASDFLARLRAKDPGLWPGDARAIQDRLGWLDLPGRAPEDAARCAALAGALRADGLRRLVVVGMGGSSLAAEMLAEAHPPGPGALAVEVLDSTVPAAVRARLAAWDLRRCALAVATKSGDTVETISLMHAVMDALAAALGPDAADAQLGRHVVAVTDPGSALEAEARSRQFRAILHGDPRVGGRFSALSVFGLLPAACLGMDMARYLGAVGPGACPALEVEGARLGAFLAAAHDLARTRVGMELAPGLIGFGGWLEQLVAESTGKDGRGILPISGAEPGASVGPGALSMAVRWAGGAVQDAADRAEIAMTLEGPHDLAGVVYLWEVAIAAAGALMGVNPFDQPDVESAKLATRALLRRPADGESRDGRASAPPPVSALDEACADAEYLAILAYLARNPASERRVAAIGAALSRRYGLAVTVGWGPRYLHSTGQLFKGDAGGGAFLILDGTGEGDDLAIPAAAGSAVSFARLSGAQARGDLSALRAAGRAAFLMAAAPADQPVLDAWLRTL